MISSEYRGPSKNRGPATLSRLLAAKNAGFAATP